MEKRFPRESEGLGSWSSPWFVVGLVEGVNDASANLVDGFIPTVYELGILARYYYVADASISYSFRITDQVGSDTSRLQSFAQRRLVSLCDCLGEDMFEREIRDVKAKWERLFAELDANESPLGSLNSGLDDDSPLGKPPATSM